MRKLHDRTKEKICYIKSSLFSHYDFIQMAEDDRMTLFGYYGEVRKIHEAGN